ncbi:MAG: ATP synthase F1 subunit epsilon [Clostridia bacterium]|nr:ATP synthase F1 subunit epsilon [Clostridia bacterium]
MNTFKLRVLAAEKPFYEGDCISLVIPTINGQYGILAMHYNMTSAIVPGVLKITTPDNEEIFAAVSEGIVKVEDNAVLLLVDTAERPEEIDQNRARRSEEMAKEAILQKKSIQDYNAAQAKMARAISRLRLKRSQNINN